MLGRHSQLLSLQQLLWSLCYCCCSQSIFHINDCLQLVRIEYDGISLRQSAVPAALASCFHLSSEMICGLLHFSQLHGSHAFPPLERVPAIPFMNLVHWIFFLTCECTQQAYKYITNLRVVGSVTNGCMAAWQQAVKRVWLFFISQKLSERTQLERDLVKLFREIIRCNIFLSHRVDTRDRATEENTSCLTI